MNVYYCIFIITYLLVIFGPRVERCSARPIKSDCMASPPSVADIICERPLKRIVGSIRLVTAVSGKPKNVIVLVLVLVLAIAT